MNMMNPVTITIALLMCSFLIALAYLAVDERA